MTINDGGGSGSGVQCNIGGHVFTMANAAACLEANGTVVPPKKDGKVCGGCGIAMMAMAKSLGWGSGDMVDAARSFVELAMHSTPVGKEMASHMARIDEHFNRAVSYNPRVLGSVIAAFAQGSAFVRLITGKPGPLDGLVCPGLTYRHIQDTYDELAKGHDGAEFQAALRFLKDEFLIWEKAPVRELRERYLKKRR